MTRRRRGNGRGRAGPSSGQQHLVHYHAEAIAGTSNVTAQEFAIINTRPARPASLYVEFASASPVNVQFYVYSAENRVVYISPPMICSSFVQRRRFNIPSNIDFGTYTQSNPAVSYTSNGTPKPYICDSSNCFISWQSYKTSDLMVPHHRLRFGVSLTVPGSIPEAI